MWKICIKLTCKWTRAWLLTRTSACRPRARRPSSPVRSLDRTHNRSTDSGILDTYSGRSSCMLCRTGQRPPYKTLCCSCEIFLVLQVSHYYDIRSRSYTLADHSLRRKYHRPRPSAADDYRDRKIVLAPGNCVHNSAAATREFVVGPYNPYCCNRGNTNPREVSYFCLCVFSSPFSLSTLLQYGDEINDGNGLH